MKYIFQANTDNRKRRNVSNKSATKLKDERGDGEGTEDDLDDGTVVQEEPKATEQVCGINTLLYTIL